LSNPFPWAEAARLPSIDRYAMTDHRLRFTLCLIRANFALRFLPGSRLLLTLPPGWRSDHH
jgi:hypothetical protein